MKIYALRDRLIDYYLTPFAAPGDKDVLSGIANIVNNGADTDAVKQAPHHFEIWRIGEVQENGTIEPTKEFIADCSSLVRRDVRQSGKPPGATSEVATPTSYRTPGGPPGATDA